MSKRDAAIYEAKLRRLILRPLFRQMRAGLTEAYSAAELLQQLSRNAYTPPFKRDLVAGEVATFMQYLSGKHRQQLIDTFRRALGVDIRSILTAPQVQAWMSQKVQENVALIKTIPPRAHAGLAGKIQAQLQTQPFDQAMLQDVLKKQYGSTGYDLRRLTRDQTGKSIGQLTQIRHQQAGIKEYLWRTSRDDRVRPLHWAYESKRFSYARPPIDGPPGTAILCRCASEPIVPSQPIRPLPPPRPRPRPKPRTTPILPTPAPTPKPTPLPPTPPQTVKLGPHIKNETTVDGITDADADDYLRALLMDGNAADAMVTSTRESLQEHNRVRFTRLRAGEVFTDLNAERDRITAAMNEALALKKAVDAKFRTEIVESFSDQQRTIPYTVGFTGLSPTGPTAKKIIKKIEENLAAFSRMIDRDWDHMPLHFRIIGGSKGRTLRANAGDREGFAEITMASKDADRTYIHEIGHALEFSDRNVLDRTVAHHYGRTAGEAPVNLRQHTGQNYDRGEEARLDRYESPYTGKTYHNNWSATNPADERNTVPSPFEAPGVPGVQERPISSTEVMSMGMEGMYASPSDLAKNDPELFKFILKEIRRKRTIVTAPPAVVRPPAYTPPPVKPKPGPKLVKPGHVGPKLKSENDWGFGELVVDPNGKLAVVNSKGSNGLLNIKYEDGSGAGFYHFGRLSKYLGPLP